MGTWGPGLYSDDTALDVREDYKDILGDGTSEPEATKRLIDQWKSELSDPDVAPVFWLALADVQWNLGRLQEKVNQEALKVIKNGSDLIKWQSDKKQEIKRKKVLERLSSKLHTAQPVEKKIKKRYIDSTDWFIGDVYSFRLQSGKYVLLHVIGFHKDKGGRGPICEILNWVGEKVPDEKAMRKMRYKHAKKPDQHLCQFIFGSLNAKDLNRERINLVAQGIIPKHNSGGLTIILWRYVDKQFEQLFGLH